MGALDVLVLVLLVLWVFGFIVVPIGGSLIHLLLVVMLIVVLVRAVRGRPL